MSNNFFGLPEEFSTYETSAIVILPVPFDKAVSWQSGASKGPEAILEASPQVELYDIATNSEVYRKGIFTEAAIDAENSKVLVKKTYEKVTQLLQDNKFIITLGGDHSISIGPINAFCDHFKDISILHLDAHSDMRDSYHDNPYSHASVIARAKEKTKNIVSVGIRSMDGAERDALPKERLFLARDICCGNNDWINKVLDQLTETVYITLDVDAFDSSLMPSTGTPEPGGLGWYHVMNLLEAVCRHKNVVGCDINELAPNPANKAPDFLVAKLLYQLLSLKFSD